MKTVETPEGTAIIVPDKLFNNLAVPNSITPFDNCIYGKDPDGDLIAKNYSRRYTNDIAKDISRELVIGLGGIHYSFNNTDGGWLDPVMHDLKDRPNSINVLKADPQMVGYVHIKIDKGQVVDCKTIFFDE